MNGQNSLNVFHFYLQNSIVQFLQMNYRICTYFKRIEMYSAYKTLHPFAYALSINESLQLSHFFQCFKKLEPIHCHCITYFPQDKIIVIYTDYLVCRSLRPFGCTFLSIKWLSCIRCLHLLSLYFSKHDLLWCTEESQQGFKPHEGKQIMKKKCF